MILIAVCAGIVFLLYWTGHWIIATVVVVLFLAIFGEELWRDFCRWRKGERPPGLHNYDPEDF